MGNTNLIGQCEPARFPQKRMNEISVLGRIKGVARAHFFKLDHEQQVCSCLSPLNRAAGSNLRMVRPSLMSMMKLVIIRAQSAWQNFGPSYFQR